MGEAVTGVGMTDAEARLARFLAVQELLQEVSREIGPALELYPVLDVVLRAMRRLVDFKGGSICLVEGDAIRLVVSDPEVSQEVKDLRLPLGTGLSGHVVATRRTYVSDDILDDPHVVVDVARLGSNATIRSWMGVPLIVLGDVIGLLQVDSADVGAFGPDDATVLEVLGGQVAGSIESARRYESVVELERLKSEFIERVSHELRTPLTIMSGFVTTLQDLSHQLSDEDRLQFIERIGHASARLRYLVEEILTIRGLDSGMAEVVPVDVAVLDVIARAVRGTGHEEHLRVEVPRDVRVRTDPALLEQAIEPLLDNAAKYAGGGTVTAERSGDVVRITVEDQGPGIDPSLRGRMYDRFVRGRHSIGGMGLGLAISSHHVASLHGEIEYEDLDPGSRFTVTLPDLAGRRRRVGIGG